MGERGCLLVGETCGLQLQDVMSDISVLIVCNKTGGTIKGDINKRI